VKVYRRGFNLSAEGIDPPSFFDSIHRLKKSVLARHNTNHSLPFNNAVFVKLVAFTNCGTKKSATEACSIGIKNLLAVLLLNRKNSPLFSR
jgi:hypothetical protein